MAGRVFGFTLTQSLSPVTILSITKPTAADKKNLTICPNPVIRIRISFCIVGVSSAPLIPPRAASIWPRRRQQHLLTEIHSRLWAEQNRESAWGSLFLCVIDSWFCLLTVKPVFSAGALLGGISPNYPVVGGCTWGALLREPQWWLLLLGVPTSAGDITGQK